jgi:hypothetical protein
MHILSAAAAVFTIGAALPAMADSTPVWKELDHWRIGVDAGNCYMATSYNQKRAALRFGFDRANKRMYFFFGDSAWKSLQLGESYFISIQLGNESPWSGPAKATRLGSTTFLLLTFPDANNAASRFTEEIAAAPGLTIRYSGKQIASWRLDQAKEAVNQMMRCEGEIIKQAGTSAPADPFASSSSTGPADPFRPL